MNAPDSPPPKPLDHDQLLATIDAEIANVQAAMAATGRNRWALTLSLSGLLWLGLQLWDPVKVSLQNVALLAISLTFLWDLILKISLSLDSSWLPRQPGNGRFLNLTRLLGALRSTAFFLALKEIAIIATLIWLPFSGLYLLTIYTAFYLAAIGIGFFSSYYTWSPIPMGNEPNQYRSLVRLLNAAAWLLHLAVAISVILILRRASQQFTTADVRLGITIAAIGYLLTVLVSDRFSSQHLTTLRSVRRNLAFSRITPEVAQNHMELLLSAGGTLSAVMPYAPDSFLMTADQIRTDYTQVEILFSRRQALIADLPQTPQASQGSDENTIEVNRLQTQLSQVFSQSTANHDELLKRMTEFESHARFIAFVSPSAAKETDRLLEKMHQALAPLSEQREKLKSILSPVTPNADKPTG